MRVSTAPCRLGSTRLPWMMMNSGGQVQAGISYPRGNLRRLQMAAARNLGSDLGSVPVAKERALRDRDRVEDAAGAHARGALDGPGQDRPS